MYPINTKNYLAFCLLLFLASSCFSYLSIPVNYSPEIDLKENENSIQYISLYDPSQLDFENEKRIGVYASGSERVKDGLQKAFKENKDFTIYFAETVVRGLANNSFPEPLDSLTVKEYCALNNTSLLLALEAFDVSYNKEVEEATNDEGKKVRTAHYYLVVRPGLSLYDSTGLLVHRSSDALEKYIDSREAIILDIAIRPSFANKQKEVDDMAFEIGNSYASKFYARTISEQRKYFTGKAFEKITPLIKSQKYEQAIDLLLPMTKSADWKTAMRACQNLGVAYEALGDYENADMWYAKMNEIKSK
ncbi:MAG: hypothetical protein JXB00_13400 [Bacteroidales bacterium]|nr:hypothetical protein [Bacteroidales bacterium]